MIKRVMLLALLCATVVCSFAQKTISGKILDNRSGHRLDNVSVSIAGTAIGTVSNRDGSFSIKIPERYVNGRLAVEQMGYKSRTISIDSLLRLGQSAKIRLNPAVRTLREVVIRSGKPEEIVAEAMSRIARNYGRDRSLFKAFYRETVQKGRRYTGVSEAIVEVLKQPYRVRQTNGERVRVAKGRRLISHNRRDTLSVKLVGGPTLPIILDFVKNGDILFDDNYMNYYSFAMEKLVSLDERLQFVISFEPKAILDYALCKGTLYIDQETLSFTRAEFEVDMSDKDKATRALLRHKPRGLRFKPQEVSFTVTYRLTDGVTTLNYIHARSRFKCDWRRRLFSSGYTTDAEMVMVDRTDNPAEGISRRMAFGTNDIFDDKVNEYWDEDFWKEYNIIEPTESLEKAVGKLLRNNAKNNR